MILIMNVTYMPRTPALVLMAKFMRILCESKGPLNKYQIEKRSKISKGTVYNMVDHLRRIGWIEVASTGRSRVGLPVEYYRLTKLGQFRATTSNPDLEPQVRNLLGRRFEELQEKATKAHLGRFREELRMADEVFTRGTAPPNWALRIELTADEKGRVKYSVRRGIDLKRTKDASST